MKKYIMFLFIPIILSAQTYMVKIEPYEEFTVYSQTSGKIVNLDKEDETKVLTKKLVQIDDLLEKKNLEQYEKQLKLYEEKLSLMEKNYESFITIRGKSKYDKDEKYYDLLDIKINISNLKLSIAELKDTIEKKAIYVNNLYIKEFLVNKGDYVSTGSEIATAYDTSSSKLVVYVSSDDFVGLKDKKILIDSKENLAEFDKIDITLDETYVSAYKVVLKVKDSDFGKVVKVEFVK